MNHRDRWRIFHERPHDSEEPHTSSLQAAVEPALRRVQQLSGRLPEPTVAAGQVEGGHGGRAELLQQCVREAGGVGSAAAQPVAALQ